MTRCLNCGSTFEPSTYQNQHHKAATEDNPKRIPAVYCSPACRQEAYQRRKDDAAGITRTKRPAKVKLRPRERQNSVPATALAASVRQPEIRGQNQQPASPILEGEGQLSRRQLIRNAYATEMSARWPVSGLRP
jgi:hypothetical protein